MKLLVPLTFVLVILSAKTCIAQDTSELNITGKAISHINKKVTRSQNQLVRTSDKALRKWIVQEQQIKNRLYKSDSSAAKSMFSTSVDSMRHFSSLMSGRISGSISKIEYNSYLDTLNTTFAFLKNKSLNTRDLHNKAGGINSGSDNINQLIGKLEYSEKIKNYIQERKKLLLDRLGDNVAFADNLKHLKRQAYYYSKQVKGITEALKDKRKAEAKAIELIRKIPAYQDFLAKNSQLASLFNFGSATSAGSVAGLQTRSQVETLLQNRVSAGGPNAVGMLSQQMDAARSKMDDLKNKFPALNSADEMPDFKPSEMKTTRFFQRLEFGSNVQFQRSNRYFPTTGDLAGQAAYKFHKNGSAGLGLSYKLGMGTSSDNIRFSGQGMGLRSFIDWKLKGTFFLNGGYEQNYQPNYSGLPDGAGQKWTQSGLAGISKKYRINSKLKGNMMVLFDFLYSQHIPHTDPIKLRLGYNF
ncbi:hypothetical protein [Chitinophaga sp. ARDCPP14]|uniref:hypothetical protein n=1 Tax=Chitinophaga sp. ARDCPP14 TaxID=3391139 RepID=UPI003F528926